MKLTEAQEVGFFKLVATKSLYDAALEYGFDKHYKTPSSIKTAAYSLYRKIFNDYSKWGISQDTYELVVSAVQNRAVSKAKPNTGPTVAEQNTDLDIKSLITSNRDLAGKLVRKKLLLLDKSKKALDNISLPQLATSFAILFDKGQLIQGMATEHVALMGKIDSEMKPEQAIEMVLKMREAEITK